MDQDRSRSDCSAAHCAAGTAGPFRRTYHAAAAGSAARCAHADQARGRTDTPVGGTGGSLALRGLSPAVFPSGRPHPGPSRRGACRRSAARAGRRVRASGGSHGLHRADPEASPGGRPRAHDVPDGAGRRCVPDRPGARAVRATMAARRALETAPPLSTTLILALDSRLMARGGRSRPSCRAARPPRLPSRTAAAGLRGRTTLSGLPRRSRIGL